MSTEKLATSTFEKDGKFGLINSDNKVLLPAKFEDFMLLR